MKDSTIVEKAEIETFVMKKVIGHRLRSGLNTERVYFEYPPPTAAPAKKILNLYLDCLKVFTMMYWEGHFVKYTQNIIKYTTEYN
jgi:hypothetical protein